MITVSIFPEKFRTSELSPTYPVLLTIDEKTNIFLTYKMALELSRVLRLACGVDLPQEEAAA